jgi:hypothetical protein
MCKVAIEMPDPTGFSKEAEHYNETLNTTQRYNVPGTQPVQMYLFIIETTQSYKWCFRS